MFLIEKPSYFMSANPKYVLNISQHNINIYLRKTGELFRVLGKRNIQDPITACFIDQEQILIKTRYAKYYLYNIIKDDLCFLLCFPEMGAELTEPVLFPNGKFADYCYQYPDYTVYNKQQLFLAECCPSPTVINLNIDEKNDSGDIAEGFWGEKDELWVIKGPYLYCYSSITGEMLHRILLSNGFVCPRLCYRDKKNLWGIYLTKDETPYIQNLNGKEKILCQRSVNEVKGDGFLKIRLSLNRKYFLIVYLKKTSVYSLASGQKVFEFIDPYNHFADFCDDDTALLIGTWKTGRIVNFLQ